MSDLLYCSFCGKDQNEVEVLVQGPAVFICSECIELCNEIVADQKQVDASMFEVGAKYRHYRNDKVYEFVSLATREKDGVLMAVYRDPEPDVKVPWVRPLQEFSEKFTKVKVAEPITLPTKD